jgi:hypothetical protein
MEGGEVKAVSFSNKSKGNLSSQVFGVIKQNWRLLEVSSERENRSAP